MIRTPMTGLSLLRYGAFSQAALRREGVYRVNVVVGLLGLVLGLYVLHLVWTELCRANAAIAPAGITLPAMLTYMVIGQLALLVVQVDSTPLIREKVREGIIAYDLLRPVRFPLYLLADNLGSAAFRLLIALPAAALAALLLDVQLPPDAEHVLAFGLSLGLGFVIAFLLDFLANLTAFWTLETFGLQYMLRFAGFVLSGVFVPLWFFPDVWRPLVTAAQGAHQQLLESAALPFASIYGTPLSIFVGRLGGIELWSAVLIQVAWILLLAAAAGWAWTAAERRVVVQGG